ncbi:6-phosphogluconate dehydrogenase [Spirosomataceae bacterium TFI 002]|nr:6-phosphogluconate dehydrogenase [Spirosomataceae bacterium TFI 002]
MFSNFAAQQKSRLMILYVMGVSGSGKSTIGNLLSEKLNIAFYDGDNFHPEANVYKMSQSIPLTDEDRKGWLEALNFKAKELQNDGESGIFACSALKDSYRKVLSLGLKEVHFIHLDGSKELIKQRLQARKGHFMPPNLLDSQFETLEPINTGIRTSIEDSPAVIIEKIVKELEKKEFGLIGLGVMGKSLARNLASRGFKLALYNRFVKDLEEQVAENFVKEHDELNNSAGFENLQQFVDNLSSPRKIFLMVNAGKVTDMVIDELMPILDKGDVIIDGGNSHFKDTEQRIIKLSKKGLHFIGTGVSGGEEGALKGPSIMPSGPKEAYDIIAPYLTAIAAKDKKGDSCCTYIGEGGSGHFVKMVHNGIEYAEMQLIAEIYGIMRYVFQMKVENIASTFENWNEGSQSSYLLEITHKLLRKKEGNKYLIDLILDKAGNKGTGSLTTITMAELGEPATMISSALFARYVSAFKDRRDVYANQFLDVDKISHELNHNDLKLAYSLARRVNHQQGFTLIRTAAKEYNWNIDFVELARIWTNGCIIRSTLMEEISQVYATKTDMILEMRQQDIIEQLAALRSMCSLAITAGVSIPCHLSAVDYLNAHLNNFPTANIIQAQRDFFGAHTFQRVDDASGKFYHVDWS